MLNRLDETTLPDEHFKRLLDLLVSIQTVRTEQGRRFVLDRLKATGNDWVDAVQWNSAIWHHAYAIWTTASRQGRIGPLLETLKFLDREAKNAQELCNYVYDCRELVRQNANLYPFLNELNDILTVAGDKAVQKWLRRVRNAYARNLSAEANTMRDRLLLLGAYGIGKEQMSPLWALLQGLSLELADERLREVADQIALNSGVSEHSLAEFRIRVQSLATERDTGDALTPSVLVVFKPDKTKAEPCCTVLVYDWEPWPPDLTSADRGRGRAHTPTDVFRGSQPERILMSEGGLKAIGEAVGERLRKLETDNPLVEFLVPDRLLCEGFEGIKVRLMAGNAASEVMLGPNFEVVVRPFERWNATFAKEMALLAAWRRRWCGLATRREPRWWPDPNNPSSRIDNFQAAMAALKRTEHLDCGLMAFGQVVNSALAHCLHLIILSAGIPVAVWSRGGITGNVAEQLGKDLFEDSNPAKDLRARIRDIRAKAVENEGEHVGKALTLMWDDPERPPKPWTQKGKKNATQTTPGR